MIGMDRPIGYTAHACIAAAAGSISQCSGHMRTTINFKNVCLYTNIAVKSYGVQFKTDLKGQCHEKSFQTETVGI